MSKCGRIMILTLGLLALAALTSSADDYIDAVKKGNEAFTAGDYKTALEQYHVAETDIPESPELAYNIAGALSSEGKYEEAVETYKQALTTTDIGQEAKTWANLGNTYFQMKDYAQAIESYQKALEIDPTDTDSKFNLELARKMLKENTKPQEEQQQQQQQQQQEQQQQKQGDEEEQQQQQQGEKEQQEQQQEPQPQPGEEKEISKEDAERILNALRDDEKDIQKQIRRSQQSSTYTGKDW